MAGSAISKTTSALPAATRTSSSPRIACALWCLASPSTRASGRQPARRVYDEERPAAYQDNQPDANLQGAAPRHFSAHAASGGLGPRPDSAGVAEREDGQWVALVLSKGTLTPTRGGVFHDLEAGRELIQRARAAEPHLPLPTYPERKVQAPPPLPPPPPQPPVAAPMLWSGISTPAWRPPSSTPQAPSPEQKKQTCAKPPPTWSPLVVSSLHAFHELPVDHYSSRPTQVSSHGTRRLQVEYAPVSSLHLPLNLEDTRMLNLDHVTMLNFEDAAILNLHYAATLNLLAAVNLSEIFDAESIHSMGLSSPLLPAVNLSEILDAESIQSMGLSSPSSPFHDGWISVPPAPPQLPSAGAPRRSPSRAHHRLSGLSIRPQNLSEAEAGGSAAKKWLVDFAKPCEKRLHSLRDALGLAAHVMPRSANVAVALAIALQCVLQVSGFEGARAEAADVLSWGKLPPAGIIVAASFVVSSVASMGGLKRSAARILYLGILFSAVVFLLRAAYGHELVRAREQVLQQRRVLMHRSFFLAGATHFGLPRESRVSSRQWTGWQATVTAVNVCAIQTMTYQYGSAFNSGLFLYNYSAIWVADKIRTCYLLSVDAPGGILTKRDCQW